MRSVLMLSSGVIGFVAGLILFAFSINKFGYQSEELSDIQIITEKVKTYLQLANNNEDIKLTELQKDQMHYSIYYLDEWYGNVNKEIKDDFIMLYLTFCLKYDIAVPKNIPGRIPVIKTDLYDSQKLVAKLSVNENDMRTFDDFLRF